MYKIGQGFDLHRLTKDRKLILGGIKIKSELGLFGHSDADVVAHALIDALLGAVNKGDIGQLFPDNDPAFKNADSMILLEKVYEIIKAEYSINNIDITILMETPKLKENKIIIANNIANCLQISQDLVSVKATTMEGLGDIGNSKAIAATCVVLLKKGE